MRLKKIFCAALCGVLFLGFTGCNRAPKLESTDLMKGVKAASLSKTALHQDFLTATADFSVELFKHSAGYDENAFVSPLSVMFSLGMTVNGAKNNTLSQAESVFGTRLDELNQSMYSLNLPSKNKSKLNISNAIWMRDTFTASPDFLQANANYYGAAAYKAAFDKTTVSDINKWVEWKTDGMIDGIVDDISPDDVMFLINAIAFDAEWQTKYKKSEIENGEFTAKNGEKQSVKFMNSTEAKYINADGAKGVVKPYYGDDYSFVALLPDSGNIDGFINSLSGERLTSYIENAEQAAVDVSLPKFEIEFKITLNNVLQTMGMTDAFVPNIADFSGISGDKNLYIGEVLHKTYISVDENGTKAAAVTSTGMKATSVAPENPKVVLNRPFVYAIIDNNSSLPVFIGALTSVD